MCYLSSWKINGKQYSIVLMPGNCCIVCGNLRAKDPSASFRHFPTDLSKKRLWIEEFGLLEADVKPFTRVCSRHFRNGDPVNGPDKTLGIRFASPKKGGTSRAQRATCLSNLTFSMLKALLYHGIIATISMPEHYGIQMVRLNEGRDIVFIKFHSFHFNGLSLVAEFDSTDNKLVSCDESILPKLNHE